MNLWAALQLSFWALWGIAPYLDLMYTEKACPDEICASISFNVILFLALGAFLFGLIVSFVPISISALIRPDQSKWTKPKLKNNPFSSNNLIQFFLFAGIGTTVAGFSSLLHYFLLDTGLDDGIILLFFGLGALAGIYGAIKFYKNLIVIVD